MAQARLIISSKNYSSWSMRGWLLTKLSGIDFVEEQVAPDDPGTRAELLLLSPSFLVPAIVHGKIKLWDTLAIAEYLNELHPEAEMLPKEAVARAHCRSISGEMHSGFRALRSALPMNLRSHHPGYMIYTGVKPDIERIQKIWHECLEEYGGPFLFGKKPTIADAMYAPVVTRFKTYDVRLDRLSTAYCTTILAMPEVIEWTEAALREPEEIPEFESEF